MHQSDSSLIRSFLGHCRTHIGRFGRPFVIESLSVSKPVRKPTVSQYFVSSSSATLCPCEHIFGVRQGLDRRPEPDSADGRSDGRGLLQDLDRCRIRFQRRPPSAGRSHRVPSPWRHPRSVTLGPPRAKPSPLTGNGCPPRIDRRRVHLTHRRNQHHHLRWPADLHDLRSARRVRAKPTERENLCRSGSSQKAGTHGRTTARTRRQTEGDRTQDERCRRLDDHHCRNPRGGTINPVPQSWLDGWDTTLLGARRRRYRPINTENRRPATVQGVLLQSRTFFSRDMRR